LIDKSNASVYNAIYKCRPAVAKKVDCNISGSNEKDIQRELDILPKIIHPNIVEYLSCLCYQGKANQQETVFIVLEKCVCNLSQIVLKETKDLNEKTITLRNGLTTKKKFDLMEDMLKGLNYIHNEISPPCIHRDLKP
jgi:serine/threonine protein kinase